MQGSVVPGTPVHNLFPPRVNLPSRNDPLTGYEPNRPRNPRGQHPYGAASPAAPLRLPGISMEWVPFYSSLIWIDGRIHLQMGQEEDTAARRIYEVNQYHLREKRDSALRREFGEIQFEEELSLQAQQQLNHWEQEEAAAVTANASRREQLCSGSNVETADGGGRGYPTPSAFTTKPHTGRALLPGNCATGKLGFTLKS